MALSDNDRLQEIFILVGDKLAPVNKKWWYALGLTLLLLAPFYYLVKDSALQVALSRYRAPQIIYSPAVKQPLQIIDKKIFTLLSNTYSGYIKIRNTELEWGVANQPYAAEFKTLGGTLITKVSGSTFVLPSSEKLIVFSRFTSQTKPDVIDVTLSDTHFIHKPDVPINFQLERVNLQNNSDGLIISAGVNNLMAFTVNQIDLPVAVYNNKNEIVAVNFTSINNVLSGETRVFQYSWPTSVAGAVRPEIIPEINIFDRNIFSTQPGISPFNNSR